MELIDSKTIDVLKSDEVKHFVQKILDKRTPQFLISMLSAVTSNDNLKKCKPQSVLGCCLKAATLDLAVDPSMGHAYIIPYGELAQFQLGYKAYIQLAMRTGQYKKLLVTEVRIGEVIELDDFTETYRFSRIQDDIKRESSKIAGYYAMFELLNGFKKEMFWSFTKLLNHGKRYSKTFNSSGSPWKSSPDDMCRKTLLRQLISKWGIMSIEMQQAYKADMASIEYKEDGTDRISYVDNDGSTNVNYVMESAT